MWQIRLFCHQLYERMRAVQQSMTMAMAVNMAHSSSTGFAPTVESGPSTQCASTTPLMSGNHASRYPPPPQQPTSHSNTGSTVSSIRHSRKRRANSNAIER